MPNCAPFPVGREHLGDAIPSQRLGRRCESFATARRLEIRSGFSAEALPKGEGSRKEGRAGGARDSASRPYRGT